MENTKNTDNISFVGKILPSNNQSKILKEMQNFLNSSQKNFNNIEFLTNFIGILLKKFNMTHINLFFDENLDKTNNEETEPVKLAYAQKNNEIYLSKKILSNPINFFYDLCIISHEFYHIVINEHNKNIVRKVGKNSDKYLNRYPKEFVESFGVKLKEYQYYLYFVNESETACEDFAYNYVLSLMKQAYTKFKTVNVESLIFNGNIDKIQKLYDIRKQTYEKINSCILPQLKIKIAIKQEELLYAFYGICNKHIKTNGNAMPNMEIIEKLINIQAQLFTSFTINENFAVLDDLKKFCAAKAYKMPLLSACYVECLNCDNYVVKEEDIKELLNYVNRNHQAFSFTDLKLNEQNLKETIIKISFGSYDKDFENSFLNNNLIRDNYALCKAYKSFINSKIKKDDESLNK